MKIRGSGYRHRLNRMITESRGVRRCDDRVFVRRGDLALTEIRAIMQTRRLPCRAQLELYVRFWRRPLIFDCRTVAPKRTLRIHRLSLLSVTEGSWAANVPMAKGPREGNYRCCVTFED